MYAATIAFNPYLHRYYYAVDIDGRCHGTGALGECRQRSAQEAKLVTTAATATSIVTRHFPVLAALGPASP
jgi:hypothetical protein